MYTSETKFLFSYEIFKVGVEAAYKRKIVFFKHKIMNVKKTPLT